MKCKNHTLIDLFFLTLFLNTINEIFTYVHKGLALGTVVSLVDEIFIVGIVLYTLVNNRRLCETRLLISLLCFICVGAIGNYLQETSIRVFLLGAFNTLKPLLLFCCFTQIDFEWEDFWHLMKRLSACFIIIAISYFIDFFTPSFRQSLGYPELEVRVGFRTLGGLFVKQTNGILWALVYFVYYKYYCDSHPKWKYWISAAIIFVSMKVKDILGFLLGLFSLLFSRIKVAYLGIGIPFFFIAFSAYMYFMPEHYAAYFENEGDGSNVARVALTYTSVSIAKDNFPFGVGFGQYGSPTSRDENSPVYAEYGINTVWGLTNEDGDKNFMCDTFWPMILGETGAIGSVIYIIILGIIFGPFLKKYINNTKDLNVLFPSVLFIIFLGTSIGKPVLSGPPHSFVLFGIAGIFYSLINKEIR